MDYDALLGDNRRLRACLDDLVRIMNFPAMWVGRDLPFIAESLLDAVQGLIDSEVTYLRLNNRSKGGADEWVRAPDELRRIVDELRRAKDPAVEQSWQAVTAADRFHVAQFPVGLAGEQGALVVASRNKPFATEAQRLLLGVAVNLAGVALMSAQDAEERRSFLERRQQELQVRTQGALLQGIAESIAAPVVFLTPDGSIEAINDRLLGFFGKTRADMERWRTSDVIHPEDRQAAIDVLRNAIATGRPYEVEARRRRSDGVYRWWRSNGYPMRDPDGKIARWCVLYTDIHDRKMTEEALRLRALDFQLVVDSIPVPVAVTTPSGEVEGVNQATMDYFGKTFEELKHWESSELVHPADIADTIAAQRQAHESASTYNVQSRHRRFDGTYRWFNVVGVPLRDREGNILRWLHLIIDIEDRKRAEEALAASERKLERIINTIPAMAWSANPDGTCDFFNRHHLDYVGRELGEMTGVGFVSTFHPDDVDRLMQAWQAMLDTGQGGEVEGRIRRRDGEYRWCLFRTNPLFDDNGVLIKWFGINIDIEDRKRAEEAVRTSERDLRQQTEAIPQMLWSATPEGNIDYCNERLLEYSGLTAESVMNGGWVNLLHQDDREPTAKIWTRCIATGEPYSVEVRQFHIADRTYRWVLTTALPLRDGDGRIVKWYGACVEIHDRKEAEDALKASEKHLAQIIDTIPAYVWSAASDGSTDFYNRHYLDYLGVMTEDVQGWNWTSIVHPVDLDEHVRTWKTALASGASFESQTRLRGSDGTYRWFLNRASALSDGDGTSKWFGITIDIEDMKHAQERLRESELNLRRLTETIPQNLFGAAADGSVNYLNPQMLEWFGRADETIMAQEWVNLVHQDDREATIKAWTSTVATGSPYHHQVRFLDRNGQYRWCDVKARALRDETGTIIAWHGVVSDIHDQKLADDALRASARNLVQIINSIPGFTWTAEADGTAEFLSKHYLDYVGLSFEEATGLGWTKTIHPDDRENLLATWQRALESCVEGEAVARIARFDGEYRWFLFRYNPYFDDRGRLVKWFGVNIDIEDRKRAEEGLRTSERNLRGLTESIPQMIWRTSPDGLVDYGNSRFLEYTGYTAEEILGTGWIRILHPEDVDRTQRVWAHAVATGEPYHIEYRVRRAADDSYRWCLVTALPLRDEDGTIMKWHGCCIDVHDWKLAQDELRATQAELAHATRVTTMGQLTASIAHELNQPLAGIMTNAGTGLRMLNGDPPNVLGAMETVRRTMRDAQRASDVISRLRALFSRRPMTSEIVDFNAATKEVVALSSNELQRKGITLRAQLDPRLPYLMGDRVQLQQVILNLVLNGAEAMECLKGRPAELVISTALEPSGSIRVSVRDCGTGLNDAAIEKLFDPFFTTKNSGMGIGLSVSRTIVENHKGRLWAENNDGPGATFSFSVPSAAAESPV